MSLLGIKCFTMICVAKSGKEYCYPVLDKDYLEGHAEFLNVLRASYDTSAGVRIFIKLPGTDRMPWSEFKENHYNKESKTESQHA